eukprot:gene5213-5279_t
MAPKDKKDSSSEPEEECEESESSDGPTAAPGPVAAPWHENHVDVPLDDGVTGTVEGAFVFWARKRALLVHNPANEGSIAIQTPPSAASLVEALEAVAKAGPKLLKGKVGKWAPFKGTGPAAKRFDTLFVQLPRTVQSKQGSFVYLSVEDAVALIRVTASWDDLDPALLAHLVGAGDAGEAALAFDRRVVKRGTGLSFAAPWAHKDLLTAAGSLKTEALSKWHK